MHLDTVGASAAKLSRNLPFIQEKVVGYFFPEISSPSPSPLPEDPPRFPTNEIAVFGFQKGGKSQQVFESAESESVVHSAGILLVDLEPIEIHFLENPWISIVFTQKQW